MHVIEVSVVICIMFGSMAVLTTLSDPPPSPWKAIDRILQQKAWDTLYVANDHLMPGGRCQGDNMLEQLVIDGVRGDDSNWTAWRDKFFAPGFLATMYFDNGDTMMTLHGRDDFLGTSSTIDYMGNMTYTITTPSISVVSGLETLPVNVAGIRDAQLLRPKGEALETSVHYTSLTGLQLEQTRTTTSATAVLKPDELDGHAPRSYAQSSYWSDRDSNMLLTRGLTSEQASQGDAVDLYFTISRGISETGLFTILPKGLKAEVRFPGGWTEIEVKSPGWTWGNVGTDASPMLYAVLDANSSSDKRLWITAKAPQNTLDAFEVIHARLVNGSLSESTLVLERPNPPVPERALPRVVHPTTPYPLRMGSDALFGLVFVNGGDEVKVDKVKLHVPGGYDLKTHDGQGTTLFATPQTANELVQAGSWVASEDGKSLEWSGSVSVPALGAKAWAVRARVSSVEGSWTGVEPPVSVGSNATLTFSNAYKTNGSRWAHAPGVVRVPVAPAEALDDNGYPTDLQVHQYAAASSEGQRPIVGSGDYRVLATATDVTGIDHALSESALRVNKRLIPAGSVAEVRADIGNLAALLGELQVADATVQLELYSPATKGCPTRAWTNPLEDLPTPGVSDVIVWDGGTPTPSMYAALNDGAVYRITSPSTTLESFTHEGGGAKLARGGAGLEARLFVAAQNGRVYSLDPATMSKDWDVDLRTPSPDAEAVLIVASDGREEILVGTRQGEVFVLSYGGSIVKHLTLDAEPIQVTLVGDDTYVMTREWLRRYDAAYSRTAITGTAFPHEYYGFGVGPTHVYTAQGQTYTVLDRLTFAHVRTKTINSEYGTTVLAGHSDANADGANDLVIATDLHQILIVSGADSALHPHGYATWTPSAYVPPIYGLNVPQLECHPQSFPGSYTSEVTCGISVDDGGPQQLVLQDGVTLVRLVSEGRPILWAVDQTGMDSLWWEGGPNDPLSIAALGDWGATPAVAMGSLAGNVQAREFATTTVLAASTPSDRVGQFSYYLYMPRGGFYGTHVLVLTVSWTQAGKEQSARLVEWFDVGRPDGTPVERFTYRIALLTEDGAIPPGWNSGR